MKISEKMAYRAEALNTLGAYLNETSPKVLAYLQNGFKLKVDGTFSKKDKEALYTILYPGGMAKQLRVWLDVSEYSIYLKADCTAFEDRYHDGSLGTVTYIKESVYLIHPTKGRDTPHGLRVFRDDYTGEYLEGLHAKRRELEEQKRAIEGEIYEINSVLGG